MKKFFLLLTASIIYGAMSISCSEKIHEPVILDLETPVISAVVDGDEIVLSWQMITNATGFKIECKKTTDTDFSVVGNTTFSPYRIKGLDVGLTYDLRIKATCGSLESEYSNLFTIDLFKYLPQPIVHSTAGISYIEVEWGAVEGTGTYQVEHKLNDDAEFTVDYTGDGSDINNHLKITGLASGTPYEIRVGAIADGYAMSYSEIASVATTEAPSTYIHTGAEFSNWLKSISSETYSVAALANDIDMEGITITSASGFAGTLECQGFAIKNLTSSVPLFAENSGLISNLVIDESCVFTPAQTVTEFGALVALDKGGTYKSVSTSATINIIASENITNNIALGGIIGASVSEGGSNFISCSNKGPVTIDATEYSHWAVAMGGIIGWTKISKFETCTNSGPITLKALYGDSLHQWSYVSEDTGDLDGNINVGGIVGKAFDLDNGQSFKSSFDHCENLEGGDISLIHTHMDALPNNDTNHGGVNVGGICGEGNGTMQSCINRAPITGIAICPANDDYWTRKNYLLKVGGIAGQSWEGISINSCSNRGAIFVNYDGAYDKVLRNISSVGGIIGRQGYGKSDANVYFSTNHGPITVSGNGHVAVGGICGTQGYQRGNRVYETATINVSCKTGYVGGLLGFADGNSQFQHIRSSYCEADITAENSWNTSRYVISVGGLIGSFSIGNTGSYPSLVPYSTDPQRCHYSGNIVCTSQMKVGMVIGWVTNNSTKVLGESATPILVSGSILRWGYDADHEMDEPLTITSSNVEDYAIGSIKEGNVTIYVAAN